MKSGIYCIENKINNKKYIGQSVNVDARIQEHKRDLLKNKHFNSHLQFSFNKHGKDNFKFNVVELISENLLSSREIFWIHRLKTLNSNYGYNKTDKPQHRQRCVLQYKLTKLNNVLYFYNHYELSEYLNMSSERIRQINNKLPYLFKKQKCIVSGIDDVVDTTLLTPTIKIKNKTGRPVKKIKMQKLLLLDLKGNIVEKFNSGTELSEFLGKKTIRYGNINTKSVIKNYSNNTKHRIVTVEFYEKYKNEILKWPPYTCKIEYCSNFKAEYHLYNNLGEYELKFKSLKTLSKFLSITEEAMRVCILKGGFHKASGYLIKKIEVDKNKY